VALQPTFTFRRTKDGRLEMVDVGSAATDDSKVRKPGGKKKGSAPAADDASATATSVDDVATSGAKKEKKPPRKPAAKRGPTAPKPGTLVDDDDIVDTSCYVNDGDDGIYRDDPLPELDEAGEPIDYDTPFGEDDDGTLEAELAAATGWAAAPPVPAVAQSASKKGTQGQELEQARRADPKPLPKRAPARRGREDEAAAPMSTVETANEPSITDPKSPLQVAADAAAAASSRLATSSPPTAPTASTSSGRGPRGNPQQRALRAELGRLPLAIAAAAAVTVLSDTEWRERYSQKFKR
jgi:hypothetical protein